MTIITADWPAPAHIQAFTTTRDGGVSMAPFNSLNLSTVVGDDIHQVEINRARCIEANQLPSSPLWLKQHHSTTVIDDSQWKPDILADAAITQQRGCTLAVFSADCLPLLICNQDGTEIAAIHAGWRGLADGIIKETLKRLQTPPEQLMVWLGPAIGPDAFVVNETTQQHFIQRLPAFKSGFIQANNEMKANLYTLARIELQHLGVSMVYGGDECTYNDSRFFSYRRDNKITGRMASIIVMH